MANPPLALCYHSVADVPLRADRDRTFVAPADLRRHIEALRSWGYSFLPFGEWARRVALGEAGACVALTFDDGFSDNLHALVPILEDSGARATVFVVAGWLGRSHPHAEGCRILDPGELAELHAAGVEVGAHTMSHPDLRTLSHDEAVREIRDSRSVLADAIGAPVTSFAYPYGHATAATREAARAAGVLAACRALGQGRWEDSLDLPRQDMGNGASLAGLRLKRVDRYMPLMRVRAARGLRRGKLLGQGLVRRHRGGLREK